MNKKKILIAILTCIFTLSVWFVGVANSKASVVYDTYSLKNNISAVKLYNEQNTLVYGGNDASLNTFNALCIDNNSIHTYLLTTQYYNQVEIYTGNFSDGWYFVLDFKNQLYTNNYSFVFNTLYDNTIGPYADIYVYVIYDDNTSSYYNINRNLGETTYIFDYNYFNTNSKLNKNVKSIRFNIPNISSIDVFNNNTNLSYDIGYQNGIDSVINSPNNYNMYSYDQFHSAYQYGYADGLDTDTSTSYNNGYSTGYTNGYNSGYESALLEYREYGVVSKVVNFNQLVKNGNFENTQYWSTIRCTINSEDGYGAIISGLSQENTNFRIYQDLPNTISGHKILVKLTARSQNLNSLGIQGINLGSGYTFNINENWNTYSNIFQCNNADNFQLWVNTSLLTNVQTTYTFEIKNVMLFDLTDIYGIGNEPQTINDFNVDFPSQYYDYTTSSIISIDYQNGYNKGVQDMNVVVRDKQELLNKAINGDLTFTNMFTSIFDVPVQTITNMLNFEFLGVNLLDFFLSIFTICIIIAVLKLIL